MADYRLALGAGVADQLRELGRRAGAVGLSAEVAAALRIATQHLTTAPLAWADPQYRLHHLGLLRCQGVAPPLMVHVAIDEQRHLVYLLKVVPLPGPPLGSSE